MAPHKGHVHILGICGTFMGGIALLAKAAGYKVTGSDANVYPPMSTQLREQGIELSEGYEVGHLQPAPDWVVVGNALSRGNPAVEYMLAQGLPYTSGPQWLAEHLLQDRWVLAVAGTHGKTYFLHVGVDTGLRRPRSWVSGRWGAFGFRSVGAGRAGTVFRGGGGRIRHGLLR